MAERAARSTASVLLGDNQSRGAPRLPGTSLPARSPLPRAYIYHPAQSPTQSGRARREWLLEFEPSSPPEIEPLMGWTASGDPFAHIRLRFPDRQSAIEFAERHGWQYELRDPPVRRFRTKSYAANFRYQLADAIGRVGPRWDGSLQITDRRESGRRAEVADSARPSAARREAAPVEGAA
jgi:ETC complex I subunit conserved region